MEKQLVKEMGISWAQAKEFLMRASRAHVASDDGDTTQDDEETIMALAKAMFQAHLEEQEQANIHAAARKQAVAKERQARKEQKCGVILLKKTWAEVGTRIANEKYLSFHGNAVTQGLIYEINLELADLVYTNDNH